MDKHMKKYLCDKLERHVHEMADTLRQLRDEDCDCRLVKLELHMVAHGRGVAVGFSVDGLPVDPVVKALERELGLTEGPEGS